MRCSPSNVQLPAVPDAESGQRNRVYKGTRTSPQCQDYSGICSGHLQPVLNRFDGFHSLVQESKTRVYVTNALFQEKDGYDRTYFHEQARSIGEAKLLGRALESVVDERSRESTWHYCWSTSRR
jgi:hypothetical protein